MCPDWAATNGVSIGPIPTNAVRYVGVRADGQREIKGLLAVLPHDEPGHTVIYKLKQADGALNFAYTKLAQSSAFLYQQTLLYTGFGDEFGQKPQDATTHRVTASGFPLSESFLDEIWNNERGVILIEGRIPSTAPLFLAVERDGVIVTEVKLHLRFSRVEEMFRHVDMTTVPTEYDGTPLLPPTPAPQTRTGDRGDPWPDWLTNGKYLVFVHGYSVNAQESRGWESETFKRFYWSRSKARFIGVDWLGNPEKDDIIADYHWAGMNALPTASKLAEILNALPGAKTIVGHSMGCLVTSYALEDFGLQVNQACLVDAPVASECYDGDSAEDIQDMAYAPWTRTDDPSTPNYPRELWAADWHKRFLGGSDARQTLTWKNRFANNAIPVIHNFYSSTEDVLGVWPGSPTAGIVQSALSRNFGSFAWVVQEKAKGNKATLLGLPLTGSDYGGWGFNIYDGLLDTHPNWWEIDEAEPWKRRPQNASEIGPVDATMLSGSRWNPLFKSGWGRYIEGQPNTEVRDTNPQYNTGPGWIVNLYMAEDGNLIAADPLKRNQLLAEAIPALSPPAGNQPILDAEGGNYPMPLLYADPATWPSARGVNEQTGIPNWLHSDLRAIAYLHTFKLFDKIVLISNQ